jgi:hypothetical protein
MEAKLAWWSPKAKDLQMPPEKLRDGSIDIEGDWIRRTRLDSARMRVKHRSSNHYDVEFATSGCLSRWQLKRTGSYRDGVLTLNRPVQEYCPITFNTLYAIRADGKELLVPAPNTADLLKDLDDMGIRDLTRLVLASILTAVATTAIRRNCHPAHSCLTLHRAVRY